MILIKTIIIIFCDNNFSRLDVKHNMIDDTKEKNLEGSIKAMEIMEGRNKIISHNNLCIIETITFYELILLNDIIKPFLFNENYNKFPQIAELFSERLSFMDKYQIVCRIAKEYKVDNFKKFDDYIRMRNKIAHNLSSVVSLDNITKESEINFAGEIITWTEYKIILQKWADMSLEMANFIMRIFDKISKNKDHAIFVYCKVIGNCILVQHNLIYPEVAGEYTSFFKSGFNMDLLKYANQEQEIFKENIIN